MASDINNVTIVGRLTRDCEAKQSMATGVVSVVRFSIASNSRRKVDGAWMEEANFFDCIYFPRQNDPLINFLVKGTQIAIIGELRQSHWESKEGEKRSRVEIVASRIQLLGGSSKRDNSESNINNRESSYDLIKEQSTIKEQPSDNFDDEDTPW